METLLLRKVIGPPGEEIIFLSPRKINYGEQIMCKGVSCLPTGRDRGAGTEGQQGRQRRAGKGPRMPHGAAGGATAQGHELGMAHTQPCVNNP